MRRPPQIQFDFDRIGKIPMRALHSICGRNKAQSDEFAQVAVSVLTGTKIAGRREASVALVRVVRGLRRMKRPSGNSVGKPGFVRVSAPPLSFTRKQFLPASGEAYDSPNVARITGNAGLFSEWVALAFIPAEPNRTETIQIRPRKCRKDHQRNAQEASQTAATAYVRS